MFFAISRVFPPENHDFFEKNSKKTCFFQHRFWEKIDLAASTVQKRCPPKSDLELPLKKSVFWDFRAKTPVKREFCRFPFDFWHSGPRKPRISPPPPPPGGEISPPPGRFRGGGGFPGFRGISGNSGVHNFGRGGDESDFGVKSKNEGEESAFQCKTR